MDEFKKCKVVILDSDIPTFLAFNFKTKEFFIPIFNSFNDKECVYKNIYVLSDDEIKEGDYVYDRQYGFPHLEPKIYKWSYRGWIESPDFEDMKVQKIIASTDKSIGVLFLSIDFIMQHIKLNGFDEILVKYSKQERCQSADRYGDDFIIENDEIVAIVGMDDPFELKEYVCRDCNFIITKLVNTSFNKEDLPIQAIKDCLKYCEDQQIYDKLAKFGDFYYKMNQFIKQNNF